MLKAELHTHTSDDPIDFIPHDNHALIDRAAALGYQVLAITLHDRQLDVTRLADYAQRRDIVLVPGVERTIEGKHVLLLNFPAAADEVATFEDLRRLKADSNGLVIAPHPFFPGRVCLQGLLDLHADLFDAVEVNAFYTPVVDFNRRARRWAAAHGRPLVGNCDVHRLQQLGTTYSVIDAAPDPDAICAAIRAGRIAIRSEPISAVQAASHLLSMYTAGSVAAIRRRGAAVVPGIGEPTVS